MHVRLAHAGTRDLDELGLVVHFCNIAAAAISHARPHTADHLEQDRVDRTLISDLPFDAFRHKLVDIRRVVLEIPIRGAVLHRADRTHAAVRLELAALEQEHVARRFFRAGQHAAHHHGVRAGGKRLADIAGKTHAAVGDHRHARTAQSIRYVRHCRDLRYAYTR